MTQTMRTALYVIGAVLMALPGLFTTGVRFYFMALIASGYLLLVIATVKYEFTNPRTALLLLLVSNLSFWFSYGLWWLRPKLLGLAPEKGIDPFAGPLSLWLIVLLTFLVYEVAVFVTGMAANRQRVLAAIGLAAVVAQALITLRTIYVMANGV